MDASLEARARAPSGTNGKAIYTWRDMQSSHIYDRNSFVAAIIVSTRRRLLSITEKLANWPREFSVLPCHSISPPTCRSADLQSVVRGCGTVEALGSTGTTLEKNLIL